jgi:hypothetical protein
LHSVSWAGPSRPINRSAGANGSTIIRKKSLQAPRAKGGKDKEHGYDGGLENTSYYY